MWDLNQGDEPIQEFSGHELVVNGLAVSPGRLKESVGMCYEGGQKKVHLKSVLLCALSYVGSAASLKACRGVCRWQKAVHWFTRQLYVLVGH